MRKWTLPIASLVAITIAVLAFSYQQFTGRGIGTAVAEPSIQSVRLGTFSTAIDYAPYYVARKKGWLDDVARKHGTHFEYADFEALPAINDALAAKRLDIVLEADTPAIIQEAAGNDLRVIAPLASLGRQLVLPPSSSIANLTDLKGKRVGVLFGTGFHYGLVSELQEKGLAQGSYTVMNLAPPEASAALSAGTIDAWAVWPPFPQQQVTAGTGKLIPLGSGRVASIMLASRDLVSQHPTLVSDIAAAIERGRHFIQASPNEAKAIVETETKLTPAVVNMAWGTMDYGFVASTPSAIDAIQKQANFLYQGKYVNRRIDAQQFFH